MSLDLRIKKETFNYTYNVAPMWYVVFPDDDGMVQIEGLTGQQSLQKLSWFYKVLVENPDFFQTMNPDNGWGSYQGFLNFIEKLILAASTYPYAKWRASR